MFWPHIIRPKVKFSKVVKKRSNRLHHLKIVSEITILSRREESASHQPAPRSAWGGAPSPWLTKWITIFWAVFKKSKIFTFFCPNRRSYRQTFPPRMSAYVHSEYLIGSVLKCLWYKNYEIAKRMVEFRATINFVDHFYVSVCFRQPVQLAQ